MRTAVPPSVTVPHLFSNYFLLRTVIGQKNGGKNAGSGLNKRKRNKKNKIKSASALCRGVKKGEIMENKNKKIRMVIEFELNGDTLEEKERRQKK